MMFCFPYHFNKMVLRFNWRFTSSSIALLAQATQNIVECTTSHNVFEHYQLLCSASDTPHRVYRHQPIWIYDSLYWPYETRNTFLAVIYMHTYITVLQLCCPKL